MNHLVFICQQRRRGLKVKSGAGPISQKCRELYKEILHKMTSKQVYFILVVLNTLMHLFILQILVLWNNKQAGWQRQR
jgi:hypothetical protein